MIEYLGKQLSALLFSSMFLLAPVVSSQTNPPVILESFEQYTELKREVSFAHLNKDVVLVGEDLGFQVYTFTKGDKLLSSETTNLYCTLEDGQGRLVRSGMLLSRGGVAHGTFAIDSSLTSGDYTFRAYTNWMRNFREHNFYSQQVRILNPETYVDEPGEGPSPDHDIQFLPEGGHLLSGVKNIVGVIARDSRGSSLPDLEGALYSGDGTKLTDFRTNRHGLARFVVFPRDGDSYSARFPSLGERSFPLGPVEPRGVALNLERMDGRQVALSIKTNRSTLPEVAGRDFILAIHNGEHIRSKEISFGGNARIEFLLGMENFWSGVNVITLFDGGGKPLLERLFFNYDGMGTLGLESLVPEREGDSVSLLMDFGKANGEHASGQLSVSILPRGTKSYGAQHNIISQLYLRPYVNGPVEDARYYFRDMGPRKVYDMDLLMLTQGWSSYSWNSIFGAPPVPRFPFEKGVTIRANNLGGESESYMVYSLENTPAVKIDVTEGSKSFEMTGLLPMEGELLSVAEVVGNGSLQKAELYYQFSPLEVPRLKHRTDWSMAGREMGNFDSSTYQMNIGERFSEGVELLDEVVVKAKLRKTRLESLPERIYGKVLDPTDNDKLVFIDLAQYFISKNIYVPPEMLSPGRPLNPNLKSSGGPLFFLDGQQVINLNILYRYPMTQIDYITVNGATKGSQASAISEGGRGLNGVVRIYTVPDYRPPLSSKKIYQQVGFPVAFSQGKKFYTPKYLNYDSRFYRRYGVVDWKPGIELGPEGRATIKFEHNGLDEVVLYLEGVTADGKFISEVRSLDL